MKKGLLNRFITRSTREDSEKLARHKQVDCEKRDRVTRRHLDRQRQGAGMIYKEESVKAGDDKKYGEKELIE